MAKDYPSGIFHIMDQGNNLTELTSSDSLTKPWVDGFRWRDRWSNIQPTSQLSYFWDDIDAAIEACGNAGKKLNIHISAGKSSPSWLFDSVGCTRFAIDTNGDGNSDGDMPLCFEESYIGAWFTFLENFGGRYDSEPVVSAVFMTGLGQYSIEFYICGTQADTTRWNAAAVTAGFTDKSDAVRTVVPTIIDKYVDVFPNTPTYFTSANPFPGDVADKNFINSYTIALPDKLRGSTNEQLKAQATHTNTGLIVDYPKGGQTLLTSGDPTWYVPNSGYTYPWPVPPTPVYDMIQTAYEAGDQFVEFFPFDIEGGVTGGTANDATFTSQRLKLISNVPVVPDPIRAPMYIRVV